MAYIIRTLGWADKEVLIFALSHILLISWALVLVLNTQSINTGLLIINYVAIFSLGLLLTKYNTKFTNKSDELD